jgi:hypothetical protein
MHRLSHLNLLLVASSNRTFSPAILFPAQPDRHACMLIYHTTLLLSLALSLSLSLSCCHTVIFVSLWYMQLL